MTTASTEATLPTTAPVQTQPAHIQGTVEYREGDGPMITIRRGPVGVQITSNDATLSWSDGETRGSAAMPIGIFRNYVARGAIKLDA
jgi:hypothetical protein